MTRKLVLNDGRSEREILLIGTITIGRDPTCQISDLDPLLSRFHAEFVTSATGVLVRDLQSRNGILVNGAKVSGHTLASGDVVQLGHLHLQYVEDNVLPTVDEVLKSQATTATALDLATVAPVRPPAQAGSLDVTRVPVAPRAAAAALDVTVIPGALRTPAAALDVTVIPGALRTPAAALDVTVVPSAPRPAAAAAMDVTRAPGAPVSPPSDARGEARLVATSDLTVTEASPGCLEVFGARPEMLLGGPLVGAVVRALSSLANGSGPSTLLISAARTKSDGTLTITFRSSNAVEATR